MSEAKDSLPYLISLLKKSKFLIQFSILFLPKLEYCKDLT